MPFVPDAPAQPAQAPQADHFVPDPPPEQSFGAALREYGSKMNPITALEGLGQAIEHPIQAIKGLAAQNERLAQDAETAFKEKRYADAARHASNYLLNMIPGLGTQSDEAGNKLASGDVAGGLADTAALATQTALGIKTPAIAQGAARGVSAVGAGLKAGGPDILAGGSKVAAGELLGKVPGMEWPARLGLGYPGARQIGRGLQTGLTAARQDLFPPPLAPLTPSTTIPWSQLIEQAGVKEPAALPAEVQQELTRPSEVAPVASTVPQAAPPAPAATVPPEAPPQSTVAAPTAQEMAIAGNRATRAASAETLSQAFQDAGISSDYLRKLRVFRWPEAAKNVGVDFPVTHEARLKLMRDTIGALEQKEASAAPVARAAVPAEVLAPQPEEPEPVSTPMLPQPIGGWPGIKPEPISSPIGTILNLPEPPARPPELTTAPTTRATAPTQPRAPRTVKPVQASVPAPAEPTTANPAASVDFGKEVTEGGRKTFTVRGVLDDGSPSGDFVKVKQGYVNDKLFDVTRQRYERPPGPENKYGQTVTDSIGGRYTKAEAKQVAEAYLKGQPNPFAAIESGLPMDQYKPGSGQFPKEYESRISTGYPHSQVGDQHFWSDGHVMFDNEAPGPVGKEIDMSKVLTSAKADATVPMEPIGFYRNNNGLMTVVLKGSDGTPVLMDRKFFDYARKNYKDVSFAGKDSKGAVSVFSGDKHVGVIMPMRLDDPRGLGLPSGIRSLLKK